MSLCMRGSKREESWLLAAESVSWLVTSLRGRSRSTCGLMAARAWARICWVLLRAVPVWPIGTATSSTFPHKDWRAVSRGVYLTVSS